MEAGKMTVKKKLTLSVDEVLAAVRQEYDIPRSADVSVECVDLGVGLLNDLPFVFEWSEEQDVEKRPGFIPRRHPQD